MRLRKEYEKTESEECLKKLRVYQDIKDTYNKISRGDYISRLVEEERQRREQEQKKQSQKKRNRTKGVRKNGEFRSCTLDNLDLKC